MEDSAKFNSQETEYQGALQYIYMRNTLGKLFSFSNLLLDSRFQLILLP